MRSPSQCRVRPCRRLRLAGATGRASVDAFRLDELDTIQPHVLTIATVAPRVRAAGDPWTAWRPRKQVDNARRRCRVEQSGQPVVAAHAPRRVAPVALRVPEPAPES